MEQYPATLDVAEEARAEAGALVRAFDETGNIGEDEIDVTGTNDAEVRVQRREGVVGDFRFCPRDRREECRLPRVRQPDEA